MARRNRPGNISSRRHQARRRDRRPRRAQQGDRRLPRRVQRDPPGRRKRHLPQRGALGGEGSGEDPRGREEVGQGAEGPQMGARDRGRSRRHVRDGPFPEGARPEVRAPAPGEEAFRRRLRMALLAFAKPGDKGFVYDHDSRSIRRRPRRRSPARSGAATSSR
jgi:hypothetical protein